ncbi:MAG: O-acetyl-ADP-ribose deacetylase [Propionibacteriaceae bacterium]|jgi:O-acetyl-ADP-ribose deacetylase (regulator of RNase III)|nr:O-acetyl-ADP-ribose deacetylase [Propionibacteriaceae bacterium]
MRIEVVLGDITTQTVAAIVNAANSSLLGGGGVDGAIHRAAGPGLLQDCRQLRRTVYPQGLPVGQAVATAAHDLPCRWVVHTVGPNRHRGQTDPNLLASCFRQSLLVAQSLGADSLAFPAIGAGVYGWPPEDVARAAATVLTVPATDWAGVALVRLVVFRPDWVEIFNAALDRAA